MSALHLVSLPVDLRQMRRCAADRGCMVDEGRALHHLLSETFGKGALQPFRMMVAPRGRRATIYAYTDSSEEHLKEQSDTATPELGTIFDLPRLAAKEMPRTWRTGRRLAFDLRVRPVRRLMKPLEGTSREVRRAQLKGRSQPPFSKGKEVDAYLVARLRAFPQGAGEGEGPSREDVYFDWLKERLGGAAELDRGCTRLVGFERTRIERQGQSEGPDATFHGEFTVKDGAALNERLRRGVGRHAAYGYGMLLLRPVRE